MKIRNTSGTTGQVLWYMWNKYGKVLNVPSKDFFDCFVYAYEYPRYNSFAQVVGGDHHRISRLFEIMEAVCKISDEIQWNDRLHPGNHTPHFPFNVTGAVDTFPVFVGIPKNRNKAKMLWHGKYWTCAFKFQLVIDLLGRPILFTGPHPAGIYDGSIWQDTSHVK